MTVVYNTFVIAQKNKDVFNYVFGYQVEWELLQQKELQYEQLPPAAKKNLTARDLHSDGFHVFHGTMLFPLQGDKNFIETKAGIVNIPKFQHCSRAVIKPDESEHAFRLLIDQMAEEEVHFNNSTDDFAHCMQMRGIILNNSKLLQVLTSDFNLDLRQHPEIIGTWRTYSPYRIMVRYKYLPTGPDGPKHTLRVLDELGHYAGATVDFWVLDSSGNTLHKTEIISSKSGLQIFSMTAGAEPLQSGCEIRHDGKVIAYLNAHILRSIKQHIDIQNTPLKLPNGQIVLRHTTAGTQNIGAIIPNPIKLLEFRNQQIGWTPDKSIPVDWQIPQLIQDRDECVVIREHLDRNRTQRIIICDPYFSSPDIIRVVSCCGSSAEREVLIISRCKVEKMVSDSKDDQPLISLQTVCSKMKEQGVFSDIRAVKAIYDFHDRWILAEGEQEILISIGKSWNSFGAQMGHVACLRGPGPFFSQLALTSYILDLKNVYRIEDVLNHTGLMLQSSSFPPTISSDLKPDSTDCLAAIRQCDPLRSIAGAADDEIREKIKSGRIFRTNHHVACHFWDSGDTGIFNAIQSIEFDVISSYEYDLLPEICHALTNEEHTLSSNAWDLCLDDKTGVLALYCLSFARADSPLPDVHGSVDVGKAERLRDVYWIRVRNLGKLSDNRRLCAAVTWSILGYWTEISEQIPQTDYEAVAIGLLDHAKKNQRYSLKIRIAFEAIYVGCLPEARPRLCKAFVEMFRSEEYPNDSHFETMAILDSVENKIVHRCLKLVEIFAQPYFRQVHYLRWLQAINKLRKFATLRKRNPNCSGASTIEKLVLLVEDYESIQ